MRWAIFVVLLSACFGYWVVQPHAQERFAWREVAPGIEMRRLEWIDNGYRARILAFRCRPERLKVAVSAGTLSAAQWRQREKAVVAVNGGFFDAENRSLGLRVSSGRRVSGFHGTRWGVFRIKNGQAGIVEATDAKNALARGVKYQQAVQCGPILVRSGQIGTLKMQWAQRTGLGVQSDGQVIVAVTETEMSLPGWAKVWQNRRALNCANALNLDGGSSTQLSLRGTQNLEIESGRGVPDAIVIVRK